MKKAVWMSATKAGDGPEIITFRTENGVYELSYSDKNHQYRSRQVKDSKGKPVKSVSTFTPSVTSVLRILDKPGLVPWAANLTARYIFDHLVNSKGQLKRDVPVEKVYDLATQRHREELTQAGDRGTAMHKFLEKAVMGYGKSGKKSPAFPRGKHADYVRRVWDSFQRWAVEVGFTKALHAEGKVFHPLLDYAGTFDLIAVIDGVPKLVDFKQSTSTREPEHPAQLAAYVEAIGVCYPPQFRPQGAGILHFDPVTGLFKWHDYTDVLDDHWLLFQELLASYNRIKVCKRICKTGVKLLVDDGGFE